MVARRFAEYNIKTLFQRKVDISNYDQQRRFIISVQQKLLEICSQYYLEVSIKEKIQLNDKLKISFSVRTSLSCLRFFSIVIAAYTLHCSF